jgi:hypothetical protein
LDTSEAGRVGLIDTHNRDGAVDGTTCVRENNGVTDFEMQRTKLEQTGDDDLVNIESPQIPA